MKESNVLDFIFSYNVNKNVLNIFEKYQEYLYYKNNPLILDYKEKILEFEVISLLESLGFSITEVGTYFYTKVIIKTINIINLLNETKTLYKNHFQEQNMNTRIDNLEKNLIEELDDLSSDFYSQLTNKEINLSLFHSYIKKSIPNKEEKSRQIFIGITNKDKISYGKLAYIIACYLINNKNNLLSVEQFNITIPNDKKKKVKLYW